MQIGDKDTIEMQKCFVGAYTDIDDSGPSVPVLCLPELFLLIGI